MAGRSIVAWRRTIRRPPIMPRNTLHPSTLAAQALGWTDPASGAVVLPIQPATTFERDPDNRYRRGRSYGRADNPGYDQPQALISALEGGAASLLFASGMAAATAGFRSVPLGAHVVAPQVLYWALRRWLRQTPASGAVAPHFCGMASPHA